MVLELLVELDESPVVERLRAVDELSGRVPHGDLLGHVLEGEPSDARWSAHEGAVDELLAKADRLEDLRAVVGRE